MKKSLIEVFTAELLRHKYKDTLGGKKKEFDHYPTKEELIAFSDECDTNDIAKDFETTIHVEKTFRVINTKSNDKTA